MNSETFEVEMNAYQGGVIRKVKVPIADITEDNVEHSLERIFFWGQNDFQPQKDRYSVSAGDVIRYKGDRYLIKMIGYELLPKGSPPVLGISSYLSKL